MALRLQIEDDGKGFDLETVQRSPETGFGLKGMNERAHLLGGHLEVCSRPGNGTQIEVVVPNPPDRP